LQLCTGNIGFIDHFTGYRHRLKMRFLTFSLLIVVLILFSSAVVDAQQTAPGQLLVQLPANQNAQRLWDRMALYFSTQKSSTLPTDPVWPQQKVKHISKTLNIWLLQHPFNDDVALEWLRQQPEVRLAQYNHLVTQRSGVLPDDPLFGEQWHHQNSGTTGGVPNADHDADLAWSVTTGGCTPAGDTIVVAVIDGGVQKNHPDLAGNLWKNRAEIPDDDLDNDGNGYIDDYYGWNVFAQNDNINGITSIHGTPVCGVIGAVGDNGVGVAGVNWHVKIMFVSGGNLESDILMAYDYILQSRQRYNESEGSKGAFVVAANCSWGIDYGSPTDAPLWCAAFDAMGQAGILSVAATANNGANVDVTGDLPTTCPSDYLITVTSLDKSDNKPPTAAWGFNSIDLGAYGEGVFTTNMNSQYGVQYGTSFAAPQVSGAVALMYAAPCTELVALAKTDPAAAALWVKTLLRNGATPTPALIGLTSTGGKLNLYNSLQQYQEKCTPCASPFVLKLDSATPFSATLKWLQPGNTTAATLRWRIVGAISWNTVSDATSPYTIEGLEPCTQYEFSVQGTCAGNLSSAWSPAKRFVTMSCCEISNFQYSAEPAELGVVMHLTLLHNYQLYRVKFRVFGDPNWMSFVTQDSVWSASDLTPCTRYEYQIQGWCSDSWVDLTPPSIFQTLGCGACLEKNYCPAGAEEATEEWISEVKIGDWSHPSGWGGGGYQNLTSVQTSNPVLTAQSSVPVVVTPGFWNASYKQFFRVFIDYNFDGDFDDANELAFDPGFAHDGPMSGVIATPAFNFTGATRMRVLMKYASSDATLPVACEAYPFGQTEDYCIDLVDTQTDAKISFDSTLLLKIYPQPAVDIVWVDVSKSGNSPVLLTIWDASGRQYWQQTATPLRNQAVFVNTTDWPSGLYFVSASAEGKVYRGKLMKR
jgi:subtilisin family serine protease